MQVKQATESSMFVESSLVALSPERQGVILQRPSLLPCCSNQHQQWPVVQPLRPARGQWAKSTLGQLGKCHPCLSTCLWEHYIDLSLLSIESHPIPSHHFTTTTTKAITLC